MSMRKPRPREISPGCTNELYPFMTLIFLLRELMKWSTFICTYSIAPINNAPIGHFENNSIKHIKSVKIESITTEPNAQAKKVHDYSQISLLVAMQIMPCSCKIHAMNMIFVVSSCPWTAIVRAFYPLTMAYVHEVKAWLHAHENRIHAHEI